MNEAATAEKISTWLRNQVGRHTAALIYFEHPTAASLATILLWLKTRQQCFVICDSYWGSVLNPLNVINCLKASPYYELDDHGLFMYTKQLADRHNAFLLSPLCLTDIKYIRNYQMHTDGCHDLFPLKHLSISEVNSLCKYLVKEYKLVLHEEFYTDLEELIPNAETDQILDLTYKEIEDTHRAALPCKLIENEEDPSKSEDFWKFTARQKNIVSQLWARNHQTKFKDRLTLIGVE